MHNRENVHRRNYNADNFPSSYPPLASSKPYTDQNEHLTNPFRLVAPVCVIHPTRHPISTPNPNPCPHEPKSKESTRTVINSTLTAELALGVVHNTVDARAAVRERCSSSTERVLVRRAAAEERDALCGARSVSWYDVWRWCMEMVTAPLCS